ncbi:MAG TPA: DUF1573 domain-containing protein [Bacteroidales bacterium]|nr:DUF1573 domain-containing protein [Bacteroidales bacterium]HPB25608.1 DUF1573 domain-containing protein [Bacteroidales bacterium]HPI29800.1 DUF1573 domain-containing protein [Bacteroidales bacterium]HQN16274.1 DUF1573 domain-containing protein [Bacteroidales bacterium]HQP15883.1 DUF1573 domain-containing protein [Bacteroidales bacterium]
MRRPVYIFFIVSLLFFSCGNNTDTLNTDLVNNPNTADGKADMSGLPAFDFVTEEHDFGRITDGEKVSFTFKFKNSGKSDLIISEAKATCGCTVADYPRTPIKPGAESGISVSFNSEGRKGIQHKTVTLVANTQPSTKVLTIKAEVVNLGIN